MKKIPPSHLTLLGTVAIVLAWSAWQPYDRLTWWLEVLPAVAALVVLLASTNFRLASQSLRSPWSYRPRLCPRHRHARSFRSLADPEKNPLATLFGCLRLPCHQCFLRAHRMVDSAGQWRRRH